VESTAADIVVASPPGARRVRGARWRALGLAALAGLAGVGVGRFVSYDGGGSLPAAVVPLPEAARIAGLERAASDRPDDPLAWQQLGSTYVRLAIATGDPDYFRGAERALERAEALDPTSAVTMVAKGTFALTLHQFDEALRLGQAAHAANPFDPQARAVQVDALVELGRYDEAAAVLQELLDRRPGLAAFTRASYLRQLRGDLSGALHAMEQAQTAAGGQPFETAVASALRGEIHLLAGELERARRAFEASLRQSPGLVTGELGRARYLEATGRRDEAIRHLRRAVDATGAPGLAILLGELLEIEGRDAEAGAAYDTARQVYRDEVTAGAVVDLEVAFLQADHGTPAAALDAARRAYAARPNIYTADAMAWALYRSGRAGEAVPFTEESLRHGTVDAALRTHAAAVFHATGDPNRAATVLAPAVALGGYLAPPLRPVVAELVPALGLAAPPHWQPG
jgi:tetratricopeptide (TPR) repeat protein